MSDITRIRCLKCDHVVEHNPRRIVGCVCDPDAPTWVYIEIDGTPRGFSQAKWEPIEQ